MKRAIALSACLLALAASAAHATDWDDEATLVSADGRVTCTGERYWLTRSQRTFWTQGRRCPLTYDQCLAARVMDREGAHRVVSCSPDSKLSRGRKAAYNP